MFKVKVAALVDTGSSINIMSSELFRSLPSYCQLSFRPHVVSKITLANNQQIAIEGTAIVKIKIPHSSQKQSILVYILKQTSHPFILGIDYLRSHGIIIDFSKDDIFTTKGDVVKVRCRNDITILPNTECIIFGKIPKRCVLGSQGVVSAHKFLLQKCVFLAKSLITVSPEHVVPIKLLNPTQESVYIKKNFPIATLQFLDNFYDITSVNVDKFDCANFNM